MKHYLQNKIVAVAALSCFLLALPVTVMAQEAYVVNEGEVITFYYDTERASRTGTVYDIDQKRPYYDYPAWANNPQIKQAVFDASFKNYQPTTTAYWFYYSSIYSIKGIENLNTSKVTDMSYMFYFCYELRDLDVSGFNTENVTNMSCMLFNCRNTNLDVSGFDTSKVTDMSDMFAYCEYHNSLDVTGFDTSNVTNMSGMFYNCEALTSLDVSNFDTSKVTDMSGMFNGCKQLTSLDLSNFDTSKVTDMRYMFYYCNNMTELNVSTFDISNVTNMRCMFHSCYGLTTLDLKNFDTSKVTDMSYMFFNCRALTSIYCDHTWTCDESTKMFNGCTSLKGAVPFDSDKLDVSMANPETGYFTGSQYIVMEKGDSLIFKKDFIKEIEGVTYYAIDQKRSDDKDIPAWAGKYNSTKEGITTVVFDSSFSDYRPQDLNFWFNDCSNLTKIEGIEYLNTSEVTEMRDVFCGCESLEELDLSHFDTSKVTTMSAMFAGCTSMKTFDLSHFNTSNLTIMRNMFAGCYAMTSIDLSTFDTSNVNNMFGLFYNCTSLTDVNVLSFVFPKITKIDCMFEGCKSLEVVDLSNFDLPHMEHLSFVFYQCEKLKTIYCGYTWTGDITEYMFKNCISLKGAVEYDPEKIDLDMANPDTGYFTKYSASAVSQINADADAQVEVFNLNGVKIADSIDGLDAGIYIVHQGEIVKKVAIK